MITNWTGDPYPMGLPAGAYSDHVIPLTVGCDRIIPLTVGDSYVKPMTPNYFFPRKEINPIRKIPDNPPWYVPPPPDGPPNKLIKEDGVINFCQTVMKDPIKLADDIVEFLQKKGVELTINDYKDIIKMIRGWDGYQQPFTISNNP